jgi:tRNA 2-thiouridine synthesizing protein E
MTSLIEGLIDPEGGPSSDPRFPHAPPGWTHDEARRRAQAEGLAVGDDHWEAVRALQEYFARHARAPAINERELHDALDEKFHGQGGIRYLYQLFPGGPVAQGCRIAGLQAPAGAVDKGFGSVV